MRIVTTLLTASLLPLGDSELATRFLHRTDAALTTFVALRHLEARNERFKVDGWLDACVTMASPSSFQFTIVREGGSSYIRNKVLRKALEGERDLLMNGEAARSALTVDNYDVAQGTSPLATGEATLLLRPKRKDALLIDGRAVVTDPEADLVRVEGRLTKTPSWWTKSVHVVRTYARRGGIRVAVETSSVADVRFAGKSSFRMTSEYVSVNGIALSNSDSAQPCVPRADSTIEVDGSDPSTSPSRTLNRTPLLSSTGL